MGTPFRYPVFSVDPTNPKRQKIKKTIIKIQIKPSETLHEKNQPSETFYVPKTINFYNYSFIKSK